LQMKKITKLFTAIIAVCTLALCIAFAGCANDGLDLGNGTGNYIAKQTETEVVFVGTTDVLKVHDGYSLYDYMTALNKKNQLNFEGYTGDYGYFITSVNGVEAVSGATSGTYWSVYISFKTLDGDDAVYAGGEYSTEYVYESTTLYSANYGVSGIPYVNGATYALVLESWGA
ncbi:MAG: DUF4430 domain-containing protein, partial [Clostridia bacterium]|nr:DUF4430 domain-containing protein [Clostridia bacterium]